MLFIWSARTFHPASSKCKPNADINGMGISLDSVVQALLTKVIAGWQEFATKLRERVVVMV